MAGLNPSGVSKEEWIMSNPTIIDYHHQRYRQSPTESYSPNVQESYKNQSVPPWESNNSSDNSKMDELVQLQLQMINANKKAVTNNPPAVSDNDGSKPKQLTSFGMRQSSKPMYDPFVEDNIEDMEISDEENQFKNILKGENVSKSTASVKKALTHKQPMTVKSGGAFYNGLILYIPPFEQITNSMKGSPAMKMLYASFDFSFKLPIKIETKAKEGGNGTDAYVMFKDQVISVGSGWAPHLEACVRALELLSETCYTIQAKEDYFSKCKLMNAETMKTLNLKRWEALSEKYPKIVEETKDSHIQKTFAVFLDNHTSTGVYEDIVCCNLTRQDVTHIKKVVEFFNLTMLPCSISTNLSKKETPCVVSIHKYASAQKLLDILIESGGENDNFKVYPPDTFKNFYKLHPSYWDQRHNVDGKDKDELKTTLDDEELQNIILKPYENTISELFKKHKSLPKPSRPIDEDSKLRKAGDDFMKETLKIDMSNNKNVAPVERMQLLLKYMEQLQEYGSRVLASGRPEMIKIYHNAIDNLRKDLDTCRQDIEKEQKENTSATVKKTDKTRNHKSRSPVPRRKTPPRRRSKSPLKRAHGNSSKNRSSSPKRRRTRSPKRKRTRSPKRSRSPKKTRSPKRSRSPKQARSPKRSDRPRKSVSPPGRQRHRSPKSRALRVPFRSSPPRRDRHPQKKSLSPPRRARSPRPVTETPAPKEDFAFAAIFQDQFKRYVEILRRFRIEIEDTPIERRYTLRDKLIKCQEQLKKFRREAEENKSELGQYLDEMDICQEEIADQVVLIAGRLGPPDPPRSITPTPPWITQNRVPETQYPLKAPGPIPSYGGQIRPPQGFFNTDLASRFGFPY